MATNPYAKKPPKFTAGSLRTDADKQPPRIIVHGVESVGKTTFAACAPDPLFLMGEQETGLLTLIRTGQVPKNVRYLPALTSWEDVFEALSFLEGSEAPSFGSLCIDTVGSLERLMHAHVCQTNFKGEWDKFAAYGSGEKACQGEWRNFLARLEEVRTKTGALFVGLCHTRITTFKNPEGADYDRYGAQLSNIGWEACKQWSDAVLFANFATYVRVAPNSKPGAKGKSEGGTQRFLFTERTAAYDAKNRYGLPTEISLGSQPADGWAAFASAMGGHLAG